MMKPNWNDAPEWANWLAMDEDGDWYWYEDEPVIGYDVWRNFAITRHEKAKEVGTHWKSSLEQRR